MKPKVFMIAGTPAEKDYHGCGRGLLVVKNNVPQLLVYFPNGDPLGERASINIETSATPDELIETRKTTRVYRGMASCYEFVAEKLLYPFEAL